MEILKEKEIKDLLEKYPLYSQDEKGGEALALFHLFGGEWDWYVMEAGSEGKAPDGREIITLYGLVNFHEVAFGYFSLSEMEKVAETLGIEKEIYFDPIPIKDIKKEPIRDFLKEMGYI